MDRLTENKIILVVRHTRLDELVARFNTLDQARFYVEHLGADFSDYMKEHHAYRESAASAEAILGRLGRVHVLDRAFLPTFIFGPNDTLVILGQDGLVANTAKYLSSQLIVGVNPDPARWDGVLLPFVVKDLPGIMPDVFNGRRPVRKVTMAKATLNDGQQLFAVNDLFIGPKSHTSARYVIKIGSKEENHSSSGIIVSTGLGSTGWFKSIIVGATGITRQLSGQSLDADSMGSFPWDANYLYYSVREPFPSRTSSATMLFGKLTPAKPLIVESQMPENGIIFSDGIERDFLEFNSGTRAEIGIADNQAHLVM